MYPDCAREVFGGYRREENGGDGGRNDTMIILL